VLELWNALVGVTAPVAGDPWWPNKAAPPPSVSVSGDRPVDCPLNALAGGTRTLKRFVDDLCACELPGLRVSQTYAEVSVFAEEPAGRTSDTALAAFAPASDLSGW
jgi:hypothetical protein